MQEEHRRLEAERQRREEEARSLGEKRAHVLLFVCEYELPARSRGKAAADVGTAKENGGNSCFSSAAQRGLQSNPSVQILQEVRQISNQSLNDMMERSCNLSASASNTFYKQAKKSSGSGFFGGMTKALTGAFTGGSSSRERCRISEAEPEMKRSSQPKLDKATPRRRLSLGGAEPTRPKPTEAATEAREPQSSKQAEQEPSQATQPRENAQPTRPGQPEALTTLEVRDYTQVPKELDEQFEKLDPEA